MQPSSPVANLLASSSSSCCPPLLPPRLPVQPCYSWSLPVYVYVCMYVRALRAFRAWPCPSDEHRRIGRAARAKKNKKSDEKNENEREINHPPSSPLHGGPPCMRVIRPSPGVKILRLLLCHVCHVPRDHGKVYHRTDTHTHRYRVVFLPCLVCVSVSVCPILLLSVRSVYPSTWSLAGGIFLESVSCSGPLPSLPLPFPHEGASSHVAAARIAVDSHTHPAPEARPGPPRCYGPLHRADSCLDSVTVDGLTRACAEALRRMRLRSVTVDGDRSR